MLLIAGLVLGCESQNPQLARLGLGGDKAEAAKNELLTAKKVDYDQLLAALDNPDLSAGRPNLIDVLVRLSERQEEPRIIPALQRHLRSDPDREVRVRIIVGLSGRQDESMAGDFLDALDDEADTVRFEALETLNMIRGKLNPAQNDRLRKRAAAMLGTEKGSALFAATYVAGEYVSDWVEEAYQEALRGRIDAADSLFARARSYAPENKKAILRQSRHFLRHGDRDLGLEQMRQAQMLLDLPRFESAPDLDGHLSEPVWKTAATMDQFFVLTRQHRENEILVPTETPTRFHMGYDERGLYLGVYCHDEHPDSLVFEQTDIHYPESDQIDIHYPESDQIDITFDSEMAQNSYSAIMISARGDITHWWEKIGSTDYDWKPDVDLATHIGEDHWSLECRFNFGPKGFPVPKPGDVWGFNINRLYRGMVNNVWIMVGDHHRRVWPGDQKGLLVFE